MDKKLLLDIINNGVDEIKEITKDFITNSPSEEEIKITINKVEILLKELHLVKELKNKRTLKSENNIRPIDSVLEKKPEKIIIKSKKTQEASEDIRNLIGINDKFLFIRELFNGDSNAYSQTIEELNNTNTLIKAEKIIQSHKWDKEEESTKLFFELLNRKFI